MWEYEERGIVRAGYGGIAAEEPTDNKITVPVISGHKKEDYFVLRVKGDSMSPKLLDGDSILVEKCDSVDSGTIAVVLYDGEEATVKKVVYEPECPWVDLVPINPKFTTKRVLGIELTRCRILGKAIKLMREL